MTTEKYQPRRPRLSSPIIRKILAINVLALAILVAGLLYLGQYRESLIATELAALRVHAEMLASALGESAAEDIPTGLQHLRAMRDLAVSRLCEVEGVRVEPPDGCSVLFPNVEQWGDENELQKQLLETFRVAVVPGGQQWFGPGGAGHLRLSFATSEGILTEGLDRLTRGLESLR